MSKRSFLIQLLDRLKFRAMTTKYLIDSPKTKYQPLPFMGISDTKRSIGSTSRLEKILETLVSLEIRSGTVVDCGCNVGFFALSLARKGFLAFGIEEDSKALGIATTAAQVMKVKFCPVPMRVEQNTIKSMPGGTVVICLSIWHHWVKAYGIKDATQILIELYAKTERVLFFDTGEHEMPADYNLPFRNQDSRAWLEKYLSDNLAPSQIIHLGAHKAFAPQTDERGGVTRNLFAIVK